MPKHANKLTCEEFQRYAAELINSGADPEDAKLHPHAKACAICVQFVQEFEAVAEAAHALFPPEWKTIDKPN